MIMQHIFRQGSVIAAIMKIASSAILPKSKKDSYQLLLTEIVTEKILPPRSQNLVNDYITHVGGNPSWYKGTIPSHMFPQWGFPVLVENMKELPYKFTRILNAGVTLEVKHPILIGEPLIAKALLKEIEDDGNRVIMKQELITGTKKFPESLICGITAIVPLKNRGKKEKKDKPIIPENVREIARLKLRKRCGFDFAMLTGDINPVHWSKFYAKMIGFPNTIMHGYSIMARTIEVLNNSLWSGDVTRLKSFEGRFIKPIIVPVEMSVFIDNAGNVFIGRCPLGSAYFIGSYNKITNFAVKLLPLGMGM
ncbi:MAG: hypothetical protein HQK76_09630 [Desulfobacterales bacterium]|nr:hypothetical protein [Desulfobacterales bacterium]